MKYRCLVLDHDDTVVNSTAAVHYPPFVAALKALRPGITLSLEDYFLFNFDPGFSAYCDNVLHFTKAEQAWQEENWLRYVADHVPSAYSGMRETLLRFRAEGGLLCVVSHSFRKNILRDYAANGLPTPDLIFGWDEPPEMRKPSPQPPLCPFARGGGRSGRFEARQGYGRRLRRGFYRRGLGAPHSPHRELYEGLRRALLRIGRRAGQNSFRSVLKAKLLRRAPRFLKAA